MYLFLFVLCTQVCWISVNPFPKHSFPSKSPMELQTGNKRDNVMHGVVWGSLRKWLWVPENMFAISVHPPDNRGGRAAEDVCRKEVSGRKGVREYSLNTISFLSEWKSSCTLHCSQVLRETAMLAFSVGHWTPHVTSSLPLLYSSYSFLQAIGALSHWWIMADKIKASNRPCLVVSLIRSCFIYTQYQAVEVIVIDLFSPLLGNFSVGQGSLGGSWQGLSWEKKKEKEERSSDARTEKHMTDQSCWMWGQ